MGQIQSNLSQLAGMLADGGERQVKLLTDVAILIAKSLKKKEEKITVKRKDSAPARDQEQESPAFTVRRKVVEPTKELSSQEALDRLAVLMPEDAELTAGVSKVIEASIEADFAIQEQGLSSDELGRIGAESLDRLIATQKKATVVEIQVEDKNYEVTRYQGGMINVSAEDGSEITYKPNSGKISHLRGDTDALLAQLPKIARAVDRQLNLAVDVPEIDAPAVDAPEINDPIAEISSSNSTIEIPAVDALDTGFPEVDNNISVVGEGLSPDLAAELVQELVPATIEVEEDVTPKKLELELEPEQLSESEPFVEEEVAPKRLEPELSLEIEPEPVVTPEEEVAPKKPETELLYGFDKKNNFVAPPLSKQDAEAILALIDGREGEIVPGEAGKNLIVQYGDKVLFETNENGEITTNIFTDPKVQTEVSRNDEMGVNQLRKHAERYAQAKQNLTTVSREAEDKSIDSPDFFGASIAPQAPDRNPEAEIRNPVAEIVAPGEKVRGVESPAPALEQDMVEQKVAKLNFDNPPPNQGLTTPKAQGLPEPDDIWGDDSFGYDFDAIQANSIPVDYPIAQELNQPTGMSLKSSPQSHLVALHEAVLREDLKGDGKTRVANVRVGQHKFSRNPVKTDGSYSISMKVDGNSSPQTIGNVSKDGVFTANPDLRQPERFELAAKEILLERGIDPEQEYTPERGIDPEQEYTPDRETTFEMADDPLAVPEFEATFEMADDPLVAFEDDNPAITFEDKDEDQSPELT